MNPRNVPNGNDFDYLSCGQNVHMSQKTQEDDDGDEKK